LKKQGGESKEQKRKAAMTRGDESVQKKKRCGGRGGGTRERKEWSNDGRTRHLREQKETGGAVASRSPRLQGRAITISVNCNKITPVQGMKEGKGKRSSRKVVRKTI